MTSPSSFYKEKEKDFDEKFNSLGYDHIDTCTCGFLEECKCESGRSKLKSHIRSLSLGLLETIASWAQNKDRPFPGPTDEDSAAAHAYSAALDDLLAFIKEEKKRIEDAK